MSRQQHRRPQVCLVSLSRHGQTPWHADNRYAGSTDIGLTAVGEAQAAALATWASAERPDEVVCSPMRRCRESAALAATVLGVELTIVPDLREMHFGIAEGRTLDEVDAEHPGAVDAFRDDPVLNAFPDSEPPVDAARRVAAALRGLAAGNPGAHLLVVAHNTALRLALCLLLGIELSHYRRVFPRIDNGALTQLRIPTDSQDPPGLLGLNLPLDRTTEDLR